LSNINSNISYVSIYIAAKIPCTHYFGFVKGIRLPEGSEGKVMFTFEDLLVIQEQLDHPLLL